MAESTVEIKGMKYQPPSVEVDLSGTVVWVNGDRMVHTATADDGSWDTGDIPPGGRKSVTFNTIGTHPYHCEYHPQMVGRVIAIEFKDRG